MISSVQDLQHRYHVWLPKPLCWRVVKEPVQGEINGLPRFRGLAVATNGIHVVLITSSDTALIGHLFWFIKDKADQKTDLFDQNMSAAKPGSSTNIEAFEEFFV